MFRKIRDKLMNGKSFVNFILSNILAQSLAMLTPLIIAKFLYPELFGSYSLGKMIVFFFTSLLIASSQTPFIIYAGQEKAKTGKINKSFSIQLIFLFSAILLFSLINLLFSKYLSSFAQISEGELFFIFLAFIGIALKTFFGNLFLALNKKMKYSLVELVFGGASILFIFIFYFLDKLNLEMIFLTYFLSMIFVFIIFIKSINFKIILPFKFDKKQFKEMFEFTKWQMFGLSAVYFINWGDNFVLRYFVSLEQIGVYNLGYQIFKGLTALIFILNAYFLPFVSQNIKNKKKIREYLYTKRPKIFLFGCIGIILLFFILPPVLNLIYGESYSESINILMILLIGSIFILYNIFYIPLFNSLKKYRFVQIANILQIILNIILNIIFIFFFGIIGAAIATLISYGLRVSLNEYYYKTRIKKLFDHTTSI